MFISYLTNKNIYQAVTATHCVILDGMFSIPLEQIAAINNVGVVILNLNYELPSYPRLISASYSHVDHNVFVIPTYPGNPEIKGMYEEVENIVKNTESKIAPLYPSSDWNNNNSVKVIAKPLVDNIDDDDYEEKPEILASTPHNPIKFKKLTPEEFKKIFGDFIG